MSIVVQHITKQYGMQKAAHDISFEVSKGEILGFLGPNGAGKSTTMKIITGYIKPDEGTVSVCGHDVRKEPMACRRSIGYLPEANPLYYDMYVREYLGFIAGIHQIRNRKARIETVIHKVGLTPEAHKKAGQLSKGYKQRVGLAAALIHDPEVLILDEPTTGLDPNQILEIREVIRQLGKDKTVLFSSHILQEVESLCERVVIINRGRLVADSKISSLLHAADTAEITLELQEAVDPALFAHIDSAIRKDAHTWMFTTTEPDSLKRELLQMALAKGLTIVSLLSSNRQNLETVFRELTREQPAQG